MLPLRSCYSGSCSQQMPIIIFLNYEMGHDSFFLCRELISAEFRPNTIALVSHMHWSGQLWPIISEIFHRSYVLIITNGHTFMTRYRSLIPFHYVTIVMPRDLVSGLTSREFNWKMCCHVSLISIILQMCWCYFQIILTFLTSPILLLKSGQWELAF